MYLIITEKNTNNGYQNISDYLKHEKNHQQINAKNEKGQTALMIASLNLNCWSSTKTIKLLLQNGADINLQDNKGLTALMFACKYLNEFNNIEIIKLLLEYGADLNIQDNKGKNGINVCM
ncbi:ankyrin repeat protein [Megavirus baoshan]|uniref:Ankyrin repeat protein n=1 Tax=Megavirus baoshan TaxID=2496520 RepID=A0A3Q8U8E2_9VIRU|nr:ankyrin repeat protein [Megavirus baoshan]AZL89591.1 ankyrin repeat protein [Megavirus baoshan]